MTTDEPLHILIADDEDIVRKTIGEYFRRCGHQVDEAKDGTEALSATEARPYDVALVDVRMPGMDGLEVLEKMGSLRPPKCPLSSSPATGRWKPSSRPSGTGPPTS